MSDRETDPKLILDKIHKLAKNMPPLSEEMKKQIKLRELTYEIRDLVKRSPAKFNYDFGGHGHGSEVWYIEEVCRRVELVPIMKDFPTPSATQIKALVKAMKGGKRVKPLPIDCGLRDCHVCDQDIKMTFDGKTFRSTTKCPYPNGMPEYSIELPVPSGKLVLANDLRDLFEDEYEEVDLRPGSRGWGFNVNTDMGCRQVFEAYGELGMAHGFVGNTCPGMYRIDKNTLTLSMIKHDEDYECIEKEMPGKRVGGVCTDLWWYSVVDYDDYVKRAGAEPDRYCDVIDVKPGVYKVTHRTHTFDRDANVTEHYAIFKWIRKSTGKDIKKKREPIVTTVEDTIKANLIFSQRIFGNRGAVLDNLFFTIGAGNKWRNGCIVQHMNPKILLENIDRSNTEVPEDLDKRLTDKNIRTIYPLSDYSPINHVPDDVRDDWLAAAFEALDMAIAIDPEYVCSSGYKNSDQIKAAKKIRKRLEKRFRDRI